MTTGLMPSILKDGFTPWFFEVESWSADRHEWESVERMFGELNCLPHLTQALIDPLRHLTRHGRSDRTGGFSL